MEGRGRYVESIGREGTMVAGDIEWMSAGRGIWHSGFAVPPIKAFQLWVALPPERELAKEPGKDQAHLMRVIQ